MTTVFLIDDCDDYRDTVRCILEEEGLDVIDTDCPHSAFKLLETMDAPDIIVCDLHMPFTTGPEQEDFETSNNVGVKTLHELAWVYPDVPVLAMSAANRMELKDLRKQLDPIPTFQKPYRSKDVVEVIRTCLASKQWGGVN